MIKPKGPGTAKGMVFVSLDLMIRPDIYAKVRTALRDHPLPVVTGMVQRANTVVNLLVQTVALLAE